MNSIEWRFIEKKKKHENKDGGPERRQNRSNILMKQGVNKVFGSGQDEIWIALVISVDDDDADDDVDFER